MFFFLSFPSNFIRFGDRDSSQSINSFWNTCSPCLIYCPCETELTVIECGAMKLDCIVCLWLITPDGISPQSAWHHAPQEKYVSRVGKLRLLRFSWRPKKHNESSFGKTLRAVRTCVICYEKCSLRRCLWPEEWACPLQWGRCDVMIRWDVLFKSLINGGVWDGLWEQTLFAFAEAHSCSGGGGAPRALHYICVQTSNYQHHCQHTLSLLKA